MLPSNNVDEGDPLLQVLDMLEDVDILRLSILAVLCAGSCNDICTLLQREKPVLELACGIGSDAFERRLEDAVHFALEGIRKVGRNLGPDAPYKKTNPHKYVYVAHKFNVMKQALMSSIDE